MIVNLGNAKKLNGEITLEIIKEIGQNEVDNLFKTFDCLTHYNKIKNIYKITVSNGNQLDKYLKTIYDNTYILHKKKSEDVITEGNRLIANYCSSIGMLIDQIERILSNYDRKKLNQFRNTCNQLYDTCMEYRFFVILRNFIIHYDLPFTLYRENTMGRSLEFQKKHLLCFPKWKHVKEDLIKMNDTINILPFITPMNVNITVLYYSFIYNVSDKLLYAYEQAGAFVMKHKVKAPVIVKYKTVDDLKKGNFTACPIDFTVLQSALNDIKSHPHIDLTFNTITPDWLQDNS